MIPCGFGKVLLGIWLPEDKVMSQGRVEIRAEIATLRLPKPNMVQSRELDGESPGAISRRSDCRRNWLRCFCLSLHVALEVEMRTEVWTECRHWRR